MQSRSNVWSAAHREASVRKSCASAIDGSPRLSGTNCTNTSACVRSSRPSATRSRALNARNDQRRRLPTTPATGLTASSPTTTTAARDAYERPSTAAASWTTSRPLRSGTVDVPLDLATIASSFVETRQEEVVEEVERDYRGPTTTTAAAASRRRG